MVIRLLVAVTRVAQSQRLSDAVGSFSQPSGQQRGVQAFTKKKSADATGFVATAAKPPEEKQRQENSRSALFSSFSLSSLINSTKPVYSY
jgi:hypothetical protein